MAAPVMLSQEEEDMGCGLFAEVVVVAQKTNTGQTNR